MVLKKILSDKIRKQLALAELKRLKQSEARKQIIRTRKAKLALASAIEHGAKNSHVLARTATSELHGTRKMIIHGGKNGAQHSNDVKNSSRTDASTKGKRALIRNKWGVKKK